MDKDLILWASFLYDMEKRLPKCQWLNIDGTGRREVLKKFLKGKSGTEPDDSILPYTEMIARAERLSGGERQNKENENMDLHRERLISIFSTVSIDAHRSKENYFLPLVPLSEKETVFPVLILTPSRMYRFSSI